MGAEASSSGEAVPKEKVEDKAALGSVIRESKPTTLEELMVKMKAMKWNEDAAAWGRMLGKFSRGGGPRRGSPRRLRHSTRLVLECRTA